MGEQLKQIACFTGHRPDKLCGERSASAYAGFHPIIKQVRAALTDQVEHLIQQNVTTFISGMSLGTDQIAAEVVIEARKRFAPKRQIRLISAVPFVGYESMWPENARQRYARLLEQADEGIIVGVLSPTENKIALLDQRNRWMVDHAGTVVAVWNGSGGGTANCVRYALAAPHTPTIIIIEPAERSYPFQLERQKR